MDLAEFLEESLCQMIEGVVNAQKRVVESGAIINPSQVDCTPGNEKLIFEPKSRRLVRMVDFDVAVQVSERTDVSGKAGLLVASLGVGGTGSVHGESASTSRISFSVPICYPRQHE